MKQKPESEQEKQYRETVEGIAENIGRLAKAVAALLNGPLKRRTLVVLLSSSAQLSQATVSQVLGALETLEKDWLNK